MAKSSKLVTMSEAQVSAFLRKAVADLLNRTRDNYAKQGTPEAQDYARIMARHRDTLLESTLATIEPKVLAARQRHIRRAAEETALAQDEVLSEETAKAILHDAYVEWVRLGRPTA